MKSPIFLFSLPRSGSTLLQRVLMSHKEIASVAEPWVMLPYLYATKKEGVLSEYSHISSYTAINDFISNLPNGEADYYDSLGKFIGSLYEKQCINNEKYFLDKTPRYHQVIPQIKKVFPDAKFIFLFRNPVDIISSIIKTWGNDRLKMLYAHEIDLFDGFHALSKGYDLLKNDSYAIQYENFVSNPEKFTREICKYLEIEFDKKMVSEFSHQNTKGHMGDSTGIKQYSTVTSKSIGNWKSVFNNNFRKTILLNYITGIHEDDLLVQGYNKNSIIKDIQLLHVQKGLFLQDRFDIMYSKLIKSLKLNLWLSKGIYSWTKKRYVS